MRIFMFNPYNMPLVYQNEWNQFNLNRQYHGGNQHHGGGHLGSNFNLGSLGSGLLGLGLGYLGSGLLNGPGQGGYGFGGYGGYPGYSGIGGYGGGPAQGFNPYGPGVGGGIDYPPEGVRVTQDWDLILICTDSSNLIRVIAAMVHGPRMNTGFLDK
jgi:hypothetical protein